MKKIIFIISLALVIGCKSNSNPASSNSTTSITLPVTFNGTVDFYHTDDNSHYAITFNCQIIVKKMDSIFDGTLVEYSKDSSLPNLSDKDKEHLTGYPYPYLNPQPNNYFVIGQYTGQYYTKIQNDILTLIDSNYSQDIDKRKLYKLIKATKQ